MIRLIAKTTVVFLLCVPLCCNAGSFKVNPVKITFDQNTKTATLKVTNTSSEKVTVQVEGKVWAQDIKGVDEYGDTSDLVFFPKIADIKSGQERLIRVGYTGPALSGKEKTYRLFVQELPVSKPGETAMKFAIRMGIPIFLQPKNHVEKPVITSAMMENGSVLVTMGNNGNSHYVVDKITAIGKDARGKTVFTHDASGWYVLAGMQRIFKVTIPPDDCTKANTLGVEAKIGKQTLDKTLTISPELCRPIKQTTPVNKQKLK